MFERTIELLGENNFNIIKNTKILLVGIGGVGGYTFDSLIRSGFSNITIIDKDIFEESNLNRQLLSKISNIGLKKVDVACEYARNINDLAIIKPIFEYLDKNNINNLDKDYDYIIDACDTLNTKLELIRYASENNIKIISCMGVGNRVDASKIKLTKLNKTNNDPLAKKLRKLVKDENLNSNIPVICSEELPQKKEVIASIATTPGIAGIFITNYIINDLINY